MSSEIFPIFPYEKEEIQEAESNENNRIYLINDEHKQKNENSQKFKILNKKRGRKKQKIDKRRHNYDSVDNLLRKLKVHYLSFIISFINDILKQLEYKKHFCKLNYDFKQKLQKKETESLKKSSIGEIICQKISKKYKKEDENYNEILFNEIKTNNKVLNNILSENYLKLFKKFYFKSHKIINLKDYGLDININLSNEVKMYDNLLINDGKKGKIYRILMNRCVKKNFIPNLIFTVN